MWIQLLEKPDVGTLFLHTMIKKSDEIDFFTDAVGSQLLGWGCIWGKEWMYAQWPEGFISKVVSIVFLELYALVLAFATWSGGSFTKDGW